jgi:hypothetical protein
MFLLCSRQWKSIPSYLRPAKQDAGSPALRRGFSSEKFFWPVFRPKTPGKPGLFSGITGKNPPVLSPVIRLIITCYSACYPHGPGVGVAIGFSGQTGK